LAWFSTILMLIGRDYNRLSHSALAAEDGAESNSLTV
jgi:hypothetical protein